MALLTNVKDATLGKGVIFLTLDISLPIKIIGFEMTKMCHVECFLGDISIKISWIYFFLNP